MTPYPYHYASGEAPRVNDVVRLETETTPSTGSLTVESIESEYVVGGCHRFKIIDLVLESSSNYSDGRIPMVGDTVHESGEWGYMSTHRVIGVKGKHLTLIGESRKPGHVKQRELQSPGMYVLVRRDQDSQRA